MLNLKEIHALHNEAVLVSKNLIRDEFLMINVLQRVDHNKVYKILKFKSLFQYATIALKLSNDRAYTFIQVSRKASGLHKMQEALKNGSLSVCKAKRLTAVISKDSEDHWLKIAKGSSQRTLERFVAKENPKTLVQEGSKFISETTLEFRAAVTENTDSHIRRVQDLLSQSLGRVATWDEVLCEMSKLYLEHKDPVVKAQRVLSKKLRAHTSKVEINKSDELNLQRTTSQNSSHAESFREPLPAELKHHVYLRDQGKCQIDDCGDSRWIDIHHKKPVHKGGENILENLITLCRSHHQMEHSH